MTAWLSTLSAAPRRFLALGLAASSVALPLALVWLSAGGLAQNWDRRAALASEISALSDGLSARVAVMPGGAGLSASIVAADQALEQRAERFSAAIEAAGASIVSRGSVRALNASDVVERRVTFVLAGTPATLSRALAEASRTPELAVSDFLIEALGPQQLEVELTLVEVVADQAGS